MALILEHKRNGERITRVWQYWHIDAFLKESDNALVSDSHYTVTRDVIYKSPWPEEEDEDLIFLNGDELGMWRDR